MKDLLKKKINLAIKKLYSEKVGEFDILVPEREGHGDYSSNISFILARQLKRNPKEIAQELVNSLRGGEFEKIEACDGYINFFLSHSVYEKDLNIILRSKGKYGSNESGKNKKIQVEFISSNPTGPMTLGNGRGGFSGDTLAEILKKNGYQAKKEFYINDAGNQVRVILAKSIFRSLGLEINIEEGEDVYGGDYIEYVSRKIKKQKGIDWIKKNFEKSGELGAKIILEEFIKKDIKYLGIKFDRWFSEKSLFKDKIIDKMWKYLKAKNLVYEQESAYWLKTSQFGDEKDRVIRTNSGNFTYLMSDLAYAYERLSMRKFDKVIMFLGADHHGYIGRLNAIAEILGHKGKIEPVIFQIVRLMQDGNEVKMSKRKGTFITLKDAADDIGVEAARYFFISKDYNHHIDIDLNIAKAHSNQNPIYYIQYASARINSVLGKLKTQRTRATDQDNLSFDKYELALIRKMTQYPEIIREVGESHQVYRIAFYTFELAETIHKFYDNCKIIGDERENTRLKILKAAKIILEDCLGLMGVEAAKKM